MLRSQFTVTVSPGHTTLGVTEPGNAGGMTLRFRVQQQRVSNMAVDINNGFSVGFINKVLVTLKINVYRKSFKY
jgi:hypothetical protein